MKNRFLVATIYTLFTVCLIVATIATSANMTKNKVGALSGPVSSIIHGIGSKSEVVVPLILDQIVKDAEPETVKAISENRIQITNAATHLLNDEAFIAEVGAIADSIGKAISAGQSEVIIQPAALVKTLADEINSVSKEKVIKASDLSTMSKPQKIDLVKASDAFTKVSEIMSKVLLMWILVFGLLALLIYLRRVQILRGLTIVLGTLGFFTLLIWFVIPIIGMSLAKSAENADLIKELAPLVYRVIAGPALIFGIIYLVLALILGVGYKVKIQPKKNAAIQTGD